jgi:hypothetical protein
MKLTDEELQALVQYFELLIEIERSQTAEPADA